MITKTEARQLRKELKQAGASAGEVDRLSELAQELKHLNACSPAVTDDRPSSFRKHRQLIPLGITAVVFLLLGMAMTSLSQAAVPGDALHGLKTTSERITAQIHPAYEERIMIRRVMEIDILIEQRAPLHLLEESVTSYMQAAEAYAQREDYNLENSVVYLYCKEKLEHARATANEQEVKVIDNTLASLEALAASDEKKNL